MLLMAVSLTLTAFGTNKFTITGGNGHPGDEVTVNVSLSTEGTAVVGEILIPLDKQLKYVDGSCVAGTSYADDYELSAALVDEGLRVVVYSVSLTPLKGDGSEFFSFKVKLGKDPATYAISGTPILGDESGNKLSSDVINGTVTILSPELTVITTSTDYGHIPIRSTYTRNITLQNSGNEPLEVQDVVFSASEFSVAEPTFMMQPGETRSVTIDYAPVTRGAISEMVTFVSNAINGKQSATLIADPFSVNELHVGSASGISDEEVTISLTMNNMEPIVAAQCTFTLPESLVYVADSFTASERAEGYTVASSLDDRKLTLLMYSATSESMNGDDGEIATFKVRLNGTNGWYGLSPENVILSNVTTENMVSATTGGSVEIKSPTFSGNKILDMGDNPVTEIATSKYTIRNSGKVDLVISKVTFLADGYSIAEELPISIEPWQSTEITVQYAPIVKGNHSVSMNIYTNDPLNRMKVVTVSGNIYEPNSISATGTSTESGYNLSINLDNYTEIAAVQMDVHWVPEISTSKDLLTLGERMNGFSYVVEPIDEGVYRLIFYSLGGNTIAQGNNEAFTLSFENLTDVNLNDTEITIDNIVLSNIGGENISSQTELIYNVEISIPGDINGDGEVNVTDVVKLYSYILGNATDVEDSVADLNGDGEVNVSDIVKLYSIILSSN